MIVLVEPDDERVRLRDPEVFDAFEVRVRLRGVPRGAEPNADDVDRVLRTSGWGLVEAGYAWIQATTIEAMTENLMVGRDWSRKFEGMLDYARDHGWWRETDRSIKAHITYG